mmetsp:Transcript_20455/g.38293  ORF Transcript_20455/g.38293 Transcript_20455/m.38293 type:complete len:869 (-) Transcript_20455:94-2700(-)
MEGWLQLDRKKLFLGVGLISLTAFLLWRRTKPLLKPVLNPDPHLPPSLKATEALKRAAALEQVKYQLELELTNQGFTGVAKIQFFCKYPDKLWLDLSVDQVVSLKIGDQETSIDWRAHRLHLTDLKIGWNSVEVVYRNSYAHNMRGLHLFVDPEDARTYIYSHCEPFNANKIFPCFDQPDIKAQFDLTVYVPTNWTVAAFTTVKAQAQPGKWSFNQMQAMPTYLFFLSAGEWDLSSLETGTTILQLLTRKSFSDKCERGLFQQYVERGLAYYSSYFNLVYPHSHINITVVPELNTSSAEGMQSFMLHEEVLGKPKLSFLITLLHELAHMWFGNLVTMKWWDDLWLKESFADFMSYFAIHQAFPEFPEIWQSFLTRKGWGYSNDQLPTTHPISDTITDAREVEGWFDGITYAKGAAVLKQLYFKVGGTSFQKRIQRFMKHHLRANATLADFLDVLDEELSNDLESWAEAWLHTAGLNELTPVIHCNSVIESFSIVQTPSLNYHPVLRPHKLKIELYDSDMAILSQHTVEVQPIPSTDLELFRGTIAPSCIILNVEDWAYCKAILDPSSLELIMSGGLKKVAEPLTRQLLVRYLWDMVRDLKLSAVEFVEVVREALEVEHSAYNIDYILEVCASGLERYIPSEHRASAFHKMFETVHQRTLYDAEILRYLPQFLDHPDDFRLILAELEKPDPTLKFTQKDRWEILKKFSAKSLDACELVKREGELDKSFSARLATLYCENAYPSPDNKKKCWAYFITKGEELSSFECEIAMKGFIQKSQSELLKPYAEIYFTLLPSIFSSRSPQFAANFAINLLPDFMEESQLIISLSSALQSVPAELPSVKKYFLDRLNFLRRRAGGLRLSEFFLNPLN